jgi:hypothetical protein
MSGTAFLFVLDDILMDSVYHHVLAWQETLHRARSVMVMSAYFKSPSESFQTAPPELTHPGLIEIADQHMPTGEETSARSLGQNSLSFPSRKRTSTTTYSFPRSSPQPRCTELFTCPLSLVPSHQTGVEPKCAQDRLGHADISVALNTYTHILPDSQAEVVPTSAGTTCGTPALPCS